SRPPVALIEPAVFKKYAPPDRAATAPERARLRPAMLVDVAVHQVPVHRKHVLLFGGIVVRADDSVHARIDCETGGQPRQRVLVQADVGVDKKNYFAG